MARISDIEIHNEAELARVHIKLSGSTSFSTEAPDQRTTILRLPEAEIPVELERSLDARELGGPVRMVTSFREPAPRCGVRVVVELASPTPSRVVRSGNHLAWEFERPPPPALQRSAAANPVAGEEPAIAHQPARVSAAVSQKDAGSQGGVGQGKGPRRRFTGRRIDLDFKDADLHNMLRMLADVGGVNLITSDAVSGTVTISMKNVPWDQALDVILRVKGLGQVREGNLIRVAPLAQLETEIEKEVARQKQVAELKPLVTRLIPVNYASASELSERALDVMSPRGKVSTDARTNTLIVTDVEANVALAEELIRSLDLETPQILIEARIVEARTNWSYDIGIQWGFGYTASAANGNPTGLVFPSTLGVLGGVAAPEAPTAGLLPEFAANPNWVVSMPAPTGQFQGSAIGISMGSLGGTINVPLRLSAQEATGNMRIIASPRIVTLDGQGASVTQGVAIPISQVSAAGANTVFQQATLSLSVTPKVTQDGSVKLQVNVSKNEPDYGNRGARGDPSILVKSASTQMIVKDGDTGVIGGIYHRNIALTKKKVPWFAEIPILGFFFRSHSEGEERNEFLVFITPRIINRARALVR